MITFNGRPVSIIAGDEPERLATIRDEEGVYRTISVERLRGTRGGVMEVVVRWREAIAKTEQKGGEHDRT